MLLRSRYVNKTRYKITRRTREFIYASAPMHVKREHDYEARCRDVPSESKRTDDDEDDDDDDDDDDDS